MFRRWQQHCHYRFQEGTIWYSCLHTCIYTPPHPQWFHTHTLMVQPTGQVTSRQICSCLCLFRFFFVHWYFQRVCLTLTAAWSLTEASLVVWHDKVCLFVCLICRGHTAVCLFGGSIESTNRGGQGGDVMKGKALKPFLPECFLPLVEMSRPPGHSHWTILIRCLQWLHMTTTLTENNSRGETWATLNI